MSFDKHNEMGQCEECQRRKAAPAPSAEEPRPETRAAIEADLNVTHPGMRLCRHCGKDQPAHSYLGDRCLPEFTYLPAEEPRPPTPDEILADILEAASRFNDKPHHLFSAIRRAALWAPKDDYQAEIQRLMDDAYQNIHQWKRSAHLNAHGPLIEKLKSMAGHFEWGMPVVPSDVVRLLSDAVAALSGHQEGT